MAAIIVPFPVPPSGAARGSASGASRPTWDQQLAGVVAVLQQMTHSQLVIVEDVAKAIISSQTHAS